MKKQFNEMIVLAEDKKPKKNSGVAAVLGLMKDLLDFQDKVNACAEAQISPESQQVVGSFNDQLVKMYKSLGKIAEGAIYEMKEEAPVEEEVVEEEPVERLVEKVESTVKPPVAPTM